MAFSSYYNATLDFSGPNLSSYFNGVIDYPGPHYSSTFEVRLAIPILGEAAVSSVIHGEVVSSSFIIGEA